MMTIENMIVVSHENEFSETMWLILAAGMDRISFIDMATSKEEAYAIIEIIKDRVAQPGEKKFREYVESVMNGKTKIRHH